MHDTSLFILFVLFLAFTFDFINGFHDAANSIATIVTTGVLTPRQAVLWAAFFNFLAFFIFNLMVAKTIGEGLIDARFVDAELILAALVGAVFWNLVTWYYGLPSSSTHALIGGLGGAAIASGGFATLKLTGFIKVIAGIFFSPALGLLISFIFTYCLGKLFHRYTEERLNVLFKSFQLASSALLSLTHGGNDAQKTMGIIAILLYSESWIKGPFHVPFWVVVSCYAVISLGTLVGGWRIVQTMGTKITRLNTMKGCAAETGAAFSIFVATGLGVPVSTTHTVTGAIAGVGIVKGINGADWGMLSRIFYAWLLTIPISGIISGAFMLTFFY